MMQKRDWDLRVACAKCGSTRFSAAEYRQYQGGSYSSGPGGELSYASSAVRVRVCLCGEPVLTSSMRSLSPVEREALQISLEKARHYRDASEPEHRKTSLRESFASLTEFEAVSDKVEHLRKIVEGLCAASETAPRVQ
jgi:hypothetical protein